VQREKIHGDVEGRLATRGVAQSIVDAAVAAATMAPSREVFAAPSPKKEYKR
jgi:hypothetical protein